MLVALRHFLSILLLPFLVVFGMPYWILTCFADKDSHWQTGYGINWIFVALGVLIGMVGVSLFSWCVILFAKVGRGTLAPWDPTRNLVAVGPYCFVRNPMISGVAMMLVGQALYWGSWLIGFWALVFFSINHIYFIFSEEPGLEKRFGESFRVYTANVPRWVPRGTPWKEN